MPFLNEFPPVCQLVRFLQRIDFANIRHLHIGRRIARYRMRFADRQIEIDNGEFLGKILHMAKDGRVQDMDSRERKSCMAVAVEIGEG